MTRVVLDIDFRQAKGRTDDVFSVMLRRQCRKDDVVVND